MTGISEVTMAGMVGSVLVGTLEPAVARTAGIVVVSAETIVAGTTEMTLNINNIIQLTTQYNILR